MPPLGKFFNRDEDEQKPSQSSETPQAEEREPGFVRVDEQGRRIVFCAKLRRELPGLARPPFPGELGQRIYEQVSQAAFDMWRQHQTILINHYGLNLGDPMAREFLREQMEYFLFHDVQIMPEEWIPEDQRGTAAPPMKGAAPRKK